MLVISYLLTGSTTHLFLAGLPYYTTYIYDNAKLTALFMGLFLGPAVLAGPLWFWVSKRIGKQRGLLLSQAIFAGGSLALLVGTVAGLVVTAVVVAAMGIAFTGLQLFAFSMVPDAVAHAEGTGNAKAGAYTGVWTATEATGTAIGPYLYAAALTLGGFVSSTAGHTVDQPHSAITALLVGFTVVPALLMLAAAAVQRRYTLDARALIGG
jgi:Na+/melibiose symporter-like transporter